MSALKKTRQKKTRFLIAFIAGIISAILAFSIFSDVKLAVLFGWDGASIVLLTLLWLDFNSHDERSTATVAKRDDMNRSILDAIIITAALASIVAVALLLSASDTEKWHIIFGLISIVLSWATVHGVYTLRYAFMYYNDKEGGVDFNDKSRPDFKDFMYLSYTIGMTYQVSDTTFTSKNFRRVALVHALLSFVFGTAIIATSINLVASLLGK